MHERQRRHNRGLYAALIGAGVAAVAVGLWLTLEEPPPQGEAMGVEREEIRVPMLAHESMLPEEARRIVERAVIRCRREPSAASFAALGRIYHGNGLTRLAAECYDIALGLGAEDALTPYLLGVILFEEGRNAEAIVRLRTAIDRDPTYPLAHHHFGRSLLQRGEVSAAIASFARAVELDPHDPVLRTGLGKGLRLDGRLDEAESALREALALDPDNLAAHQLLGLVLHASDRPEEAERHLARLQQYNATVYNDPWMWEAYRHAASVEVRMDWARNLLQYGRVESAITLLSELAARHPQHPGVFRALADALSRSGDHQRAIHAYGRAADLDPADAQSRLAIAQILFAYDKLSDADDMARRAMTIDSTLTEALAVRGAVALRQGRLQEARLHLEQALRDRPDYLQAAAYLGETFIALNRHEEAVDVLTSALLEALPGGGAVAYAEYQLAVALTRLERLDEAEEALRRAAAIEPENEHIQQKLATLRETPTP